MAGVAGTDGMSALGAVAIAIAIVALGACPLAPTWHLRRIAHPDAASLADAGWRWSLVRWEAVRAATVATAIVVLAAAGGPVPLGLAASVGPSFAARLRAQAAREASRIPATRILVAAQATLRSGAPLAEALRRGLDGCDDRIARQPLESALARFDLGEPLDRTLADAAQAMPVGRAAAALDALSLGVSERLPIERVGALLGAVTDRLLFEERLAAEVQAHAAGARTQMWLLAALVPALALYLAFSMPALATTLGGPVGRTVLVPAALLLEIAGVLLSRRVVRVAP